MNCPEKAEGECMNSKISKTLLTLLVNHGLSMWEAFNITLKDGIDIDGY